MDPELSKLHQGARDERRALVPETQYAEASHPPTVGRDLEDAATLLGDAKRMAENGDGAAAEAAARVALSLLDPDDEPDEGDVKRVTGGGR